MADQIIGITIKGIGDFSDVVSNVNNVQKALTKLKLPDKLGDSFSKNIANFTREYDKYQRKIAEGIKTQGDQNAVDKSLNSMMSSYRRIIDDFSKLSSKDFKEIFNLDIGKFAPVQQKIKSIQEELKKLKLDPKQIEGPLATISKLTKAKPFDKLKEAFATDDLAKAKEAMQEIDTYYTRFESKMSKPKRDTLGTEIEKLRTSVNSADVATEELQADMLKAVQALDGLGSKGKRELNDITNSLKTGEKAAEDLTDALKRQHSDEFSFSKQVDDIDRQIQSYFGLTQMIRKVGDIARDAFNTVKELDAAMTETAVVTNFSVGDMWNMLPTYTEQANKLGATIKDVYEAATLYYQQGLNTNQAMGLANETLKMARIAGLDAAEATDMMTSALRGFNMEINQASAQKVNDIYSQLAAVTASDTREIGTAMEKTASLAASANMDIETTSAFLAQMIETTREAPENLGTAMKTIIARFQEMKKDPTSLVDSEGVAMDVNKVDTALKSIGVALTNSKGEFRDLDDVFLDISKRWDSLSQGQQRYIATTAAGSRQQSRFIAMMSNYDRTMELVNEANNSAGASQKQFEKTMDSMSSKLNQLKNAWNEFSMGLMNNQILKTGVTALTGFFTVVNKIIDALSKIPSKPFEGITKSALTLVATLSGLNFGKKFARGTIAAGKGWWEGKGTLTENFMSGYGVPAKKDYNTESTEALQQKIKSRLSEGAMSKALVTTPVTVDTYLESIDTLDLDQEVINKIKAALDDDLVVNKRVAINTILRDAKKDKTISEQQYEQAHIGGTDAHWQMKGKGIDELTKKTGNLTNGLMSLGTVLQEVGSKMGPFGGILSTIGSVMVSLGSTLGALRASFLANFESEMKDAAGALADAAAKKGLAKANAEAAITANALKNAIWSTVGPFLAIAAAIGLAVAAYVIWDKLVETDAERMERLTDSANTASDTYDSLKQSTSELKSSLEEIQSNEDSFEGLVAGTTEFNDKLTETNQKIDELLLKYPQLNEYLSVDKNGLKHISQEGIDFIKKQQDQLVGNASAQNVLQNARLKAEQDKQKAKQNERDIHDLEYARAYDEEGNFYEVKRSLTAKEQARVEQLKQESEFLKENAENSEKIAVQQALAASFTNIEASDRDRMASMYIDSYEAVKKRAEVEKDESKMLQTYADYYGYQYDAASKKVLDSSGEEVEIDKEALKSVYSDIVATIDIQASAESLDKIENDVNQKFSKGLKLGASRGDNVLSGVLTGDIETNPNLVKKLAKQSSKNIEKTLSELKDEELSALTGKEFSSSERKDVIKEFTATVKDKAQKTLEAQNQIYKDLGVKIAKTDAIQPIDITAVGDNVATTMKENWSKQTQTIAESIGTLSVKQANTLNNVADKIEKNVGLDTMDTFLDKAISIYQGKNGKLKKEFDSLINNIDWESPSSRLAGYTKAIKSSQEDIQNWGKDMKNTASEANLVGEAFDEFVSGDWQELAENADDFQNSLGEIDGAGILKAAEQSRSLKNLLDSGAVSATGVATALQGIESGKYSIGEVDSVVLQLISSFNRLEDASLRAHNTITNFDPGIDTGEGEDFVKDNAKKAQEYYDNGEWGNQQLENYIKLAAGEERWNKTLKDNKGDLQATTKELMKYVNTFKDGFGPVWDQIDDKTISGGDAKTKIEKVFKGNQKLIDEYKNFDAFYNEDGYLNFNIGNLSTEQLKTYFQEIYGVSQEYADLLLQDLKNYSGTLEADLQKNDLREAVQSDDFRKGRTNKDGKNLILTDAELRAFRKNGGNVKQLALDSGYTDTVDKKTGKVTTAEEKLLDRRFKVFEGKSGKRRDDYDDHDGKKGLYTQYREARGGILLKDENLQTKEKLDLNKLIADATSWSMDDEQAMHMAFKAYRKSDKKGQATLYEGMEVESGITNYEDFVAAVQQMTETSQWVQVGETIGSQIVNAFQAANILDKLAEGKEIARAAFTKDENNEGQFNKENFSQIVNKIAEATDDKNERQQSITDYLSQSKEVFQSMKPEEQAKALDGIVNKLNDFKFKPEEISSAIKDGLGIKLGKDTITGKAGKVDLEEGKVKEQLEKELENTKATISEIEVPTDILAKKFSGITAKIDGLITSITYAGEGAATGQNNPNSAFHRVGTMARGSRKGYTISGRPTLTGEEGEELVWEPKRNEAYMVGSQGPQFANISKDAVVWNADQTKRIKKNSGSVGRVGTGARGINSVGTMAGGTKIPGSFNIDIVGNFIEFKQPEQKPEVPATITADTSDIKILGNTEGIVNVTGIATVTKVVKGGKVSGEPVTVKAKASVSANTDKLTKKINKVSSKITEKDQKMTIDANNRPALQKVQQIIDKINSTHPTLRYSASGPTNIKVDISPNFTGTWEKTVKIKKNGSAPPGAGTSARGVNNKIVSSRVPLMGSMARPYGRLGPKGKGGPTLTGEEGFEIAWLPSESRSMLLGVGGPQMIDLPSDAVVYTHEQSKDIIKRKGIPAGSHSGPSTTGRHKEEKEDTSSGKNPKNPKNPKKPKDNKGHTKEIKKIVDKASKVSVWWENQTRKVDAVQRQVDKTLKAFEKATGKIGATAENVKDSFNAYVNKLNKSLSLNKKSRAEANKSLKKLDTGKDKTSISWDVTEKTTKTNKKGKKKTSKKTVKKDAKISLSKYIREKDGTYIIDQKELDKIKSKNKKKAIKEAAEKEINDRLSRRNTAQDNIDKAQEALDKLSDDVYKTFYAWENSLNKTYLLSQKLEDLTNRLGVRESREELIEARATAGFGQTDDRERLYTVLEEEKKLMLQQLEGNKANLTASAKNYEESLQLSTYFKRYAKAPDSQEAKDDFNAAKLALKFLKDTGLNTSDTFNYDKAIAALEGKGYSENTVNRIKEVLDKINENRGNLVSAQNETLASATAIYNKLSEYQDFIVEFENDLLTGLEDQTEKEINKLDKLNSSLSQTLRDLLDNVKQSLDERREQEDNVKTQQDISQKQQRLAMLRADTSGSHQTEIAQLEKEIAEAQQNYGRSLEDQLINKLQQQGDNAEKQRQRQIELLQAQQEIAKVTGANLGEVKKLLEDGNEERIKNAWLSAKGYDDALPDEKQRLENEWSAAWTKYQAYSGEATQLKTAIESNKSLSDIEKFVSSIDTTLSQKVGNDAKSFKANNRTAKEAKLAGFSAKQLKDANYSNKEIAEAGYKKADLAKAGVTAKNLKSSKISAKTAKAAGFTAKELKDNKYSLKELVDAGYGLKELTSAGYTAGGIAKAAKELKMKPEAIAKKYGATVALKADVSGATVQKTLGTSTSAIQKIINKSTKDAATQKDLAKTKASLDINGKKKGGVVKGTVNKSGQTATANKGSTLYSQSINTKTGKTTGKVTKKTIDKLTTKDFNRNKKEATDALVSAIKNKKVGSKINEKMKELVAKAGIAGKKYKLNNGVEGSISSNGKIYYNTKDGVKIWDAAAGKLKLDKYNKNEYLKIAQKNNNVSREYAQVLINKKAFTKEQLRNKGVKKFASGGLADFTGPVWLDGTPTKPEVVLSAADTKNFIMLRDVLSKAMGATNSTNNAYTNSEFNININVDKISDDYDVDKIITKVKKEIIKSAGYRNVTQVRNFR